MIIECKKDKNANIFKKIYLFKQNDSIREQAGAELGQAQLKLGLDLNSINLN